MRQFFLLRIHPLLPITLFYIGGIIITSATMAYCIAILLMLVSGSAIYRKCYTTWNASSIVLCCLLFYLIGYGRIYYQVYRQQQFDSYVNNTRCDLIGTITDIHPVDHPFYTCCITVCTTDLKYSASSEWMATEKVIQFYTLKKFSSALLVGDRIAIPNVVFKSNNNTNFAWYLMKEGMHASLFISDFQYTFIERPTWSLYRANFYLRQRIFNRLKASMSAKTFYLFASIFLGNKNTSKKLVEKTKEHFNTWGVTHYLARSGLHLVIFICIWQIVLSLMPLAWLVKELFLIALTLLYCYLSWHSVSFTRALLTFCLYKTCTLFRVSTQFLHLLTCTCLLVLLYNPLHVFFLDFQLSFGLTFALALFNQIQTHHKYPRYKTIAS